MDFLQNPVEASVLVVLPLLLEPADQAPPVKKRVVEGEQPVKGPGLESKQE